jgi:hypothetical protein
MWRRVVHEGDIMILGVIVLSVVTHIMGDGRVLTQETIQPSMEECHRQAEAINKANGAGKYEFSAQCREEDATAVRSGENAK